ncbi:MAG: PotD/PotF family extracellular solute-binding protein [Burkholderiales bacterium]
MKKFIFALVCSTISIFAWAGQVLNVYIGANYIASPTIISLEKLCQCHLSQNYFNDNDEMLAKVVAGASGYNVIVATSYAVEELAKMGKIQPLNLSQISHLASIDPNFLNQPYDPGNKYSVPYAYTPVFLAYNVDKMHQLGITPNSWAVVFDPQYLVKLKGRVTMFNSARNIFAAALLYLGKDPNSTNLADLKLAREVINKAAPYWAKFDSDSYYRGLLRGDIWLSMSYSTDIFKAINDAKAAHSPIRIGAMLQQEGNMYELDNMVIPTSTPNLALSYEFINNALKPQSEYELSMMTGSSVPSIPALKRLSPSITAIEWIYPKNMQKMHVFNAYDPKTRILVNEMWTEIQMQCHY